MGPSKCLTSKQNKERVTFVKWAIFRRRIGHLVKYIVDIDIFLSNPPIIRGEWRVAYPSGRHANEMVIVSFLAVELSSQNFFRQRRIFAKWIFTSASLTKLGKLQFGKNCPGNTTNSIRVFITLHHCTTATGFLMAKTQYSYLWFPFFGKYILFSRHFPSIIYYWLQRKDTRTQQCKPTAKLQNQISSVWWGF